MSSLNFSTEAAASASTSTGAIAITFSSVNLGYIWTGSVQIPAAQSSSVLPVKFTAFDAGVPIGSWYNDQSSGNIQVLQQLSITATGLTTGSYRAFFKGMISPEKETPPFWPGPTPAPPPGTPQTLVNIAGFLPGAGSSLLSAYPSQSAPVLLGTSLEVLLFSAATNSARLTITWSLTATGAKTSQFTFDVPNAALTNPLTGLASVLSGLVLPNLGSFVQITAANATPATGTIDAIINTGLPPITRPPIVPGGVLAAKSESIPGAGSIAYNLPPYVGEVCLSAELASGPLTNFDVQVVAYDYLANSAQSQLVQATQLVAGSVSTVPPTKFFVPPRVVQLIMNNRNAGPVSGNFQLVAAGP